MNASLVSILILFLSTCQGMEQDGSPPSGMLPTTKWQKKVETRQEASCPDPTDIEPCECTNSSGYLVMNCSVVQDEEELRRVFSAFFPTTEFYLFRLWYNKGIKVLEDGVFGNVSFEILDIDESVLETVEIGALNPSLSTCTHIWIISCKLETFPFERLAEFTSLQFLDLPGNNIHTLPPLSSSTLSSIDLGSNFITNITAEVFTLLQAIDSIHLHYNNLTEIPTGTFTGLPKLEVVNLYGNNISYLQTLTFELLSIYSFAEIYLENNNIEYVEVDTFKGVSRPARIYMDNNTLTSLPEEVWRPVLELKIVVSLSGNNLVCDCDMAWLIRDPDLLTTLWLGRCDDGTLLTDLNPADFDHCGKGDDEAVSRVHGGKINDPSLVHTKQPK